MADWRGTCLCLARALVAFAGLLHASAPDNAGRPSPYKDKASRSNSLSLQRAAWACKSRTDCTTHSFYAPADGRADASTDADNIIVMLATPNALLCLCINNAANTLRVLACSPRTAAVFSKAVSDCSCTSPGGTIGQPHRPNSRLALALADSWGYPAM